VAELCLPSTTLSRSDGGLRTSISFWILIDATDGVVVYVNLGSARASLRREARRGSRSFNFTLFWAGDVFGPVQRQIKVPSLQTRDLFRSCPAFRGRDQPLLRWFRTPTAVTRLQITLRLIQVDCQPVCNGQVIGNTTSQALRNCRWIETPAKLAIRCSLQFGVFRLGFPEDRDVGVGVFPESKEILIALALAVSPCIA
jgi:hypothetical protein